MTSPLPEPAPSPRGGTLLAAASVAAISAATLFPTGDTARGLALCLFCGERGVADAILNVLMFAPFGGGLALRGTSPRGALALGGALSASVELLQAIIPGRDASPPDLLFNTLGAVLGWALLRAAPGWLAAPPARARRFLLGAVLLPLLLLLGLGLALAPHFPRDAYFGQWTADLPHLERYRGRVTAASVGEVPVFSWRIAGRSERVRSLLLAGAPISVAGVAGPPPPGTAPIFSIYDEAAREIVLVGADREDAVFQYRMLGTALRLDQPGLRFPGAFRGVRAGDALRIAVVRRGRGYCMQVNRARRCSLGFTLADTWGVLLFPSYLPGGVRTGVGLLWIAALFAPAGLWVRGRREALPAGALAVAGLVAVPLAAGLLPTPPPALLAALAGMGAGALARRALAS